MLVQLQSTLYISMVLVTSLYLQRVLGLSALQTGVCFVAQNSAAMTAATFAPSLVARLGAARSMAVGVGLLGCAALWLGRAPSHGTVWLDALPGIVLIGLGAATGFVSANALGFSGIAPHEAGLASGVMNTFQQVGSAVGVALLTSIAAARTATLTDEGRPRIDAVSGGLGLAWHVGAGIAAVGVTTALVVARRRGRAPALRRPV